MAKKRKKLQPMNEIMLEMESVLEKLTDPDGHDMQWYEVLALVHRWLEVHAPHAQETYSADGTHPVFFYGPAEKIRN